MTARSVPPAPQSWGEKAARNSAPIMRGDAAGMAFSPQDWGAGGPTRAHGTPTPTPPRAPDESAHG